MGKYRSNLKSHSKGKRLMRGQTSTSNPTNQKHRSKAKSRFFKPNLSLGAYSAVSLACVLYIDLLPILARTNEEGGLTSDALARHEVLFQNYDDDRTVNDIAQSLKSYQINGGDDNEDDAMTQTKTGTTYKTRRTFASDYSSCTNVSFSK